MFKECFREYIRRNEGLLQDYFKLLLVVKKEEAVDFSVYVYCFAHYCRCSDLQWTHWKELFLEDNTDGECVITSLRHQRRCTTTHHQSHSYYKDNLEIKYLLQEQDDEISSDFMDRLT